MMSMSVDMILSDWHLRSAYDFKHVIVVYETGQMIVSQADLVSAGTAPAAVI